MKRRILVLAVALIIVVGVVFFVSSKATAPAKTTAQKSTKSTTSISTVTPPVSASFDSSKYSLTDPDSIWVVVNKHHPLNPKVYAPNDLVSVGNGQVMRAAAAAALTKMFDGAKQAGFTLTAASAYRSYPTQVTVYNKEVVDYGQARADSESARPGYSEHQTGLAVDVAGGGCSITDCFGDTPEGIWATAHAYEYGYILRYTSDKTAITGYRAEAWHFRYVGTDLSYEMHKDSVKTLEEFFGLDAAPDYN